MTLMSVQGVTKRFGGVTAVDDMSFDIHSGMIKGVIGPNGAGKSTLFNCITGFTEPSSGVVVFRERTLRPADPRSALKRGIARTFQTPQLFDEMTTLENVMVGAQSYHRERLARAVLRTPGTRLHERDLREHAGRCLRRLGIDEWASDPARVLPSGVRRLTEIARALATGPELLLLDEPAAGLNEVEASRLEESLRRIRDEGVTILIIEHDLSLVMGISDELVVMDQGAKIAEGPPRLIQKDPAVIAAYLGSGEDE